jgi:glycosyltransferase involved in cell wall biosynthesis
MKILCIADGLCPPHGRISGMKIIARLIERLQARGYEMHVLSFARPGVEGLADWIRDQRESTGVTYHLEPRHGVRSLIGSRILLICHARRLCRSLNCDVLQDFSSSPIMAWRTVIARLNRRIKTVHTVSTARGAESLCPRMPATLDALVCTEKWMSEAYGARGYRDGHFVPLGIDLDEVGAEARKAIDLPCEDGPTVLYVGPLSERKGAWVAADVFSRVAAAHPAARFIVATNALSDDRYRYDEMRTAFLARCTTPDRVHILEGRQNIPALMRATDVFLYPLQNAFGTLSQPATLIEAMCVSAAIVATDLSMVTEHVANGRSALVAGRTDAAALAHHVLQLIGSEEQRATLGQQANRDALAFGIDRTEEAYAGLYRELGARGDHS